MSTDLQKIELEKNVADPRVDLAIERTELALERTHLAWIRTMFTIMTSGIAIDKGLELIYHQRLLKYKSLVESGHVIGIFITTTGIILLLIETSQFVKKSRRMAAMKKKKFVLFSTNLIVSIMVMLVGLAMIYLMIGTN